MKETKYAVYFDGIDSPSYVYAFTAKAAAEKMKDATDAAIRKVECYEALHNHWYEVTL